METGYVTSKGHLIIPLKLRRKFGIKPGTRVNFFEEKDGIKIIPVTPELIDSNKGFLGTRGKLLKALLEEKKKYGIKKGTKVAFIEQGDKVIIQLLNKNYFNKLAGVLNEKDKMLMSLMDDKQRGEGDVRKMCSILYTCSLK